MIIRTVETVPACPEIHEVFINKSTSMAGYIRVRHGNIWVVMMNGHDIIDELPKGWVKVAHDHAKKSLNDGDGMTGVLNDKERAVLIPETVGIIATSSGIDETFDIQSQFIPDEEEDEGFFDFLESIIKEKEAGDH